MNSAEFAKNPHPTELYNFLFHYFPFGFLTENYKLTPEQLEQVKYLIAAKSALLDFLIKPTLEERIIAITSFIELEIEDIYLKPKLSKKQKSEIQSGKNYIVKATNDGWEMYDKLKKFNFYQLN